MHRKEEWHKLIMYSKFCITDFNNTQSMIQTLKPTVLYQFY